MNKDQKVDEGYIFSEEDYIFNVKWKVNSLKEQGYSEKVILLWEDNNLWWKYAKIFINEYK